MTLPVYIPSLGRAESFARRTLAWMPEDHPVRIVVPPEERDTYAARLPGKFNAQILPCPEKGIAAVRRWVGEEAARRSEPHFLMLDDDLNFFSERSDASGYLRKATEPDDMVSCLHHVEYLLRIGYAAVGISPRQGNNRMERPYTENTRLIRALAFQTGPFLAAEHERVQVMEDFDVLLQLLRAGMPNANLTWFAQDQDMTQAPGGCSTYRTHQNHEDSARRLAELHPNFVKLRQKQNKTGGDFGTRTEVTIQWKRAWEDNVAWSEKHECWHKPETDHLDMVAESRREFGSIPVKPEDILLDLGAHIGGYTTHALKHDATVYACEPAADNAGMLRRNIRWYERNYGGEAFIDNAAVADKEGVAELFLSPKHQGKGSCMASMVHQKGRRASYTVPAVDFYETVESVRPSIIKCDVEAAEYLYAWEFLPDCVHTVAMELHLSSKKRREQAHTVLEALKSLGFTLRSRALDSTEADINAKLAKESTWAVIVIAER